MKNHWLEKRRTKEQRKKILKEIADKGLVWFAPQGLNRGTIPSPTKRCK